VIYHDIHQIIRSNKSFKLQNHNKTTSYHHIEGCLISKGYSIVMKTTITKIIIEDNNIIIYYGIFLEFRNTLLMLK